MQIIEKKLIIVKNREGLNSIYIYKYIAGVGYYPVFLIHTAEFDCKYFRHPTEVSTHVVLQLVIS